MFATFAGGYSRRPNPGLDDVLAAAEAGRAAGILSEAEARAAADEFVREIIKEQAVVGLHIGGDGGVRLPDRVLPLIRGLGGLAPGEAMTFPDGEAATRPLVRGSVTWTDPITVADWEFAADATNELLVKQTLLGPYTVAALALPPGRDRAALALALGEALNRELRALQDAGCAMIEIDEPLAAQIGDGGAEWAALGAANRRLVEGIDQDEATHLSLAIWGGNIDPAGHATLIDLPYRSYLVDVLAGPSAWRFIDAVPADRGIIVGSADSSTDHWDETEVHVWAMAWAENHQRGSTRVGCSPNGSLTRIGRHFAHRKCYRLGEAIRVALAGPLQDVALALDEHPDRSWMPELRTMAAAVAAARRSS
jgi:methionine synthase II (cobalamin-independent)